LTEDEAAAAEATPMPSREPAVAADAPEIIEPDRGSRDARPAVIEDGTSLAADRVGMYRSAVGRIEAGAVEIQQGAVGAARVEHLSADRSAVGAVMAGNVEVSRGYVRSILARQVQLDRGAARVVIAADVRAHQSAVMFLVARRVSGEMRVLLDWRGALAFGAAAGVVFAFLTRLRRGKQD
jgi:hypothetical protein